jgi:hypothetical protein
LAFQQFSVSHLLPLVTTTPVKYLQGGLLLVNGFMPVVTILLFSHLIEQPRKLSATVLGAAGSASLLFLLELLGTIGVFGATFLQRFTWSNLALVQRINIPYLVLEQIGPLFLVVWLTEEVDRRSFATTIGIDALPQDKVMISVQIPLPQKILPPGIKGAEEVTDSIGP